LTYSYPTVAKTLRDTFGHKGKKKCKEEKEKHGHMCSMMAMQMEGGLGYDDLNELMKVRKIKISSSRTLSPILFTFFHSALQKLAFFDITTKLLKISVLLF
jgi:hypothetical protein